MKDPFIHFKQWFEKAKRCESLEDATAMCVATVNERGHPDARMVLLKEFDARGFVFFTNLHSPKGHQIKNHPYAALTFHWAPLQQQVRIQGKAEYVPDAEADAYWRTRPRLSQLGAWASQQSEELKTRVILVKEVAKLALKFGTAPVPRPPYWTGIRVIPDKMEFWQGQPNRLHDRFLYTRKGPRWQVVRLYP